MPERKTTEAKGAMPTRAIMLPYRFYRDCLPSELVTELMQHTLAIRDKFTSTRVGKGAGAVDQDYRVSVATLNFGPCKEALRTALLARVPEITRDLRVRAFEPAHLELELVAHGDGAFFKPHIDTRTGEATGEAWSQGNRILSLVYYFHRLPKAFSGGALRLHPLAGEEDAGFVDIEPEHNTLLAFHSWAPHEVRMVSVPSGRFEDYRFALNCWIHRARPAA